MGCKCFFFFSVQYDELGFFLAPRVGNKHHSFTDDQLVFSPTILNKDQVSN